MVTTSPRFAVPPPVAPLCMLLAAGTGVATAARPLGSYMDLWERIAEAAASLRPIPDSMPATARGTLRHDQLESALCFGSKSGPC